ncbi:hypothetical protein [Streptomyces sp. NPDC002088]|uniref:hypothetical protein n=1 Tax=Streptomyces sp. NPDC002088 TaxID=3154665 RepID=UPI003332F2B4
MARKTTTTTTVNSRKDSDGNWEEYDRQVVTVVERDDEGYPYGPIRFNPGHYGLNPFVQRSKTGAYGDWMAWYEALGARPAAKEQEDGQDG